MTVYSVWANQSETAVVTTRNRGKAFTAALRAARRRRNDVAVYDDAGHVYDADGRPAFCPLCHRGQGHLPGPPHCRRVVERLL